MKQIHYDMLQVIGTFGIVIGTIAAAAAYMSDENFVVWFLLFGAAGSVAMLLIAMFIGQSAYAQALADNEVEDEEPRKIKGRKRTKRGKWVFIEDK